MASVVEMGKGALLARLGIPARRLLISTAVLVGITVATAAVLRHFELPQEKEGRQRQEFQALMYRDVMFRRFFKFFENLPSGCTDCASCFPGPVVSGNLTSPVLANGLGADLWMRLDGACKNQTHPEPACVRVCLLELPSSQSVEGCFLQDQADMLVTLKAAFSEDVGGNEGGGGRGDQVEADPGEMPQPPGSEPPDGGSSQKLSMENPIDFNETCLHDHSRCPNCAALAGPIELPGLQYLGLEGSSSPSRYLRVAHMYLNAKTIYELLDTDGGYNWEWQEVERKEGLGRVSGVVGVFSKGSIFFATTVLSTIGYGSYAPVTDESKLLLAVMTIPLVAIFGYSVTQVSRIVLETVDSLYRRFRRKLSTGASAMVFVRLIHKHDEDGDNMLNQDEFLSAAKELDVDVDSKKGRAAALELFWRADKDGSGTLDAAEGVAYLSMLYQKRQATISRESAAVTFKHSLGIFLILIAMGTVFFKANEDSWSYVDSFYFCIVTLTTVGLGDFAPSVTSKSSLAAWYLYIVIGLGLAASIISAVADMQYATGWMDHVIGADEEEEEEGKGNGGIANGKAGGGSDEVVGDFGGSTNQVVPVSI